MIDAATNGQPRQARGTGPTDQRPWPHNLDAEAGVLGGVIIRNDVLHRLDDLEVADFFDFRHKTVWAAIRNLQAADRPIDTLTLETELAKVGKLEAVGDVAFLGELALRVPTADNVVDYANTVKQLHKNRQTIIALEQAARRAWAGVYEPGELVTETIGELQRLDQPRTTNVTKYKSGDLLTIGQACEELEVLARAPIYETPFPTLNSAIGFGGLIGTQVYTVAAGTGRGKTSWVAAVAAHVAESGPPVIVASYEMKPGYFIARRAAGALGVHSNTILRGGVSMAAVMAAMPYGNFFLMHRPTLAELRMQVDKVSQRFGQPPLIVVDYLQKLADAIAQRQQRPDLRIATTEASATLLAIAEQTWSPIIAISAIGRGKGKQLAQPRKYEPYELVEVAKESGAVEYDGAGLIVLTLQKEFDADDRVATMTLAKARFGLEMHIDARYHGARGSWRDLGQVDAIDAATPPAPPVPEPSNDELRQRLILELQAAGPAKNKTALLDRCKGNRKLLGLAFETLIDDGAIVRIGTGINLSEKGRQLVIEVAS